MADLGRRLYDLRTMKGLTMQQVAEYVGVNRSTVKKWESGFIANMRRDKIKKLAEIYDTTVEYIAGWSDSPVHLKDSTPSQNQAVKLNAKDRDRRDELLRLFDQLDDEGQGRVLECASDQIAHGRVKKSNTSALIG